jgi:TfuA protein
MGSFKPVVFAGVSLSHAEVRDLADAECRPPIKAGDLDRLRGAQSTIVIIDGELAGDAVLPVDELERAISRGFNIRGASSVGALRAAEFHERGMRGSGWVYRAFRDGRILGTEEIAVLYDPLSLSPLTIPLVTVRFWLGHFVSRGVIGNREVDYAISALKAVGLKNRTQKGIAMQLAGMPIAEEVEEEKNAFTHPIYDIKAHDARCLLRCLNTG